ncbi:prenyltransferase/squalene oxidase repeat-containing protein [Candidatus Amarolinea dominans]|uniref:prenyltransferase/squalene oxidase repeat-containing protein n=1 Tax=Candidatus Amarolinea dominans TaxID=3140696 RepID=UPI0031370936|nr:hypothetical protein [Anaerolineae bacterium]
MSTLPTRAAKTIPNTIGLVVQHADGRVETRTVLFSEPTISGLEALQRTGLALELSGALVCRIGGTGCPSADCFCGCPAPFDPCFYWSYFNWNGHAWDFAAVGAGERQLHDGDVDGWRWSQGQPPDASAFTQLAVQRALAWLHTQQQADGSFPGFGVGATADAVIALAAANEKAADWRVGQGPSALAYLATQAGTFASSAAATGKLILAVAAADANPTDFGGLNLLTRLATFADAGGRFGASNWDQAYAILALRASQAPIPHDAAGHLLAAQTTAGGWGFMPGDTAGVDSTALVMQALIAAGEPLNSPAMTQAVAFLHTQQNQDGGFPYQSPFPTSVSSTALALQGLLAVSDNPLAAGWTISNTTPFQALLAQQSAAGGFVGFSGPNDLFSTVSALPALVGKPLPLRGRQVALDHALTWLHSQQQADGSFGAPGQSADAVFAAVSGGQDPATWTQGGPSLLAYLASQAMTYTLSSTAAAGKLTLAALASRPDRAPNDFGGVNVGARVLDAFDPGSGQIGSSLFDHGFGLLAMSAQYAPGRWLSRAWLRQQQLANGGWELGSGWGADTNTTAVALQALLAAGEPADAASVQHGLTFLRQQQNPDGGFPYQKPCGYPACDATDVNSTAYVVQALVAAGHDPDGWAWSQHITATNQITLTLHTPLDALLARQSQDGGFAGFSGANDLYATVQAVPAVALRAQPLASRATWYYPGIRR